jgi:hypothetical protein
MRGYPNVKNVFSLRKIAIAAIPNAAVQWIAKHGSRRLVAPWMTPYGLNIKKPPVPQEELAAMIVDVVSKSKE